MTPTLTWKLLDDTIHNLIGVSTQKADVCLRKVSLHPRLQRLEPRRIELGQDVAIKRRRTAKGTERSPRHDAIRTPDASQTGCGEQIDVSKALPLTPHRGGEELR